MSLLVQILLKWHLHGHLLLKALVFFKNSLIHESLIVRETAHDLLCMQTPFWERIQKVRNTELDTLWKSFRVQTFNSFLLNAIPTFVSVGTFTVYVLLGNKLTAAKAFTSLSLFSVS